jgi:hypothetical protein
MTLSVIVDASTGQPLLGKVENGKAAPLTHHDILLVIDIIRRGDEAKKQVLELAKANEHLETAMGMERLDKFGKLATTFQGLREDRERLEFILARSGKWRSREMIDERQREEVAGSMTPIAAALEKRVNGH